MLFEKQLGSSYNKIIRSAPNGATLPVDGVSAHVLLKYYCLQVRVMAPPVN